MSVVIREAQLKKMLSQINYIFDSTKKEELLVNDIRDCLMGNGQFGIDFPRWKGLTSRNLELLPEGKKFTSDLEFIGSFERLVEDIYRCETRYEKHGAGIKVIMKRPGSRLKKKYGREFDFMDKQERR